MASHDATAAAAASFSFLYFFFGVHLLLFKLVFVISVLLLFFFLANRQQKQIALGQESSLQRAGSICCFTRFLGGSSVRLKVGVGRRSRAGPGLDFWLLAMIATCHLPLRLPSVLFFYGGSCGRCSPS